MGKFKDISGTKHKMLTAIQSTNERDNRGCVIWECICDCGKTIYIPKDAFDNLASCGCICPQLFGGNRHVFENRLESLVGNKVGRLSIINVINDSETYREREYLCKCDCGKELNKKHYRLKSGKVNSCGCIRKEKVAEEGRKTTKSVDITGMRYGLLTAVEPLIPGKINMTAWWKFECDCGAMSEMTATNFLKETRYSCGCIQSKGEAIVTKILRENNIFFKKQYQFKDLKGIGGLPLRFDFGIIYDGKLVGLIEYDGNYHYKNNDFFKSVDITMKHDIIKNDYCRNLNIPLLRLRSRNKKDIEEMLKWIEERCRKGV